MSYEEKSYVQDLRDEITKFIEELAPEFVKQSRRPNRESEKRTRKLLGSFYKRVAIPYKRASLEDLKSEENSSPAS